MCGKQAPTALMCAPGFSHSKLSTGSADCVTVQITSAPRTASSFDSTARAAGHLAASRSAFSRGAGRDPDLSNGRASSIASTCG